MLSLSRARSFARSTPRRTFVVYPLMSLMAEVALHQRLPRVDWRWVPLVAWGYLQYRLVGNYRRRRGGGGPGVEVPPARLVTDGPYAVMRNPMYLGHMLFMVGLTLTLRSSVAAGLTLGHAAWFHRRVLKDEVRLEALFGEEYRAYKARVSRWLPGLL